MTKRLSIAFETLQPYEFQIFCALYLEDQGFKDVHLGRSEGKDQKHDIYGLSHDGTFFVAHCSFWNSGNKHNLKTKITNETIGVAEFYQNIESDTIKSIYIFTKRRVFSPIEERLITDDLLSQLSLINSQYKNGNTLIRFVFSDEMLSKISMFEEYKSTQYLFKKLCDIENIASRYMSEDVAEDLININSKAEEFDKWRTILWDFSDELPLNHRLEQLLYILDYAWVYMLHDPSLSLRINNHLHDKRNSLYCLLKPICRLSLGTKLSPVEITLFCNEIHNLVKQSQSYSLHTLSSFLIRFIKCALYANWIIPDDAIEESLKPINDLDVAFWQEFYTDIFYRHICNYIILEGSFLEYVLHQSEQYRINYPYKPLSRIFDFLLKPITVVKEKTIQKITIELTSIASFCRNQGEARWTLASMSRVVRIAAKEDPDLEFSDAYESIFKAFSRELMATSSFLLYRKLSYHLKAFIKTKNPHYLVQFENDFKSGKINLYPNQIFSLLSEYSSSLYIAAQYCELNVFSRLQLGKIASHDKSIDDDIMFSNDLITKDTAYILPSRYTKRDIFRVLKKYINKMISLYVLSEIEKSHLSAFTFPATFCVYSERKRLCNEVLNSLRRYGSDIIISNKNFYAQSLTAFKKASKTQETFKIMMIYLNNAIEADDYAVLSNINAIYECLYSCYYYDLNSDNIGIKFLSTLYAKKSNFNDIPPVLAMLYYAGIFFDELPQERALISEIAIELEKINKEYHQLRSNMKYDLSATIPISVITLLTKYELDGSLIARYLKSDLTNPFAWNVISTTLHNNRKYMLVDDNTYNSYCALIYSIAKCFARERNEYDQKYCYNYIRSKALSNIANINEFIYDAWTYISSPNGQFFNYKEDCTDSLFLLLKNHNDEINADLIKIIKKSATYYDWIMQQLNRHSIRL